MAKEALPGNGPAMRIVSKDLGKTPAERYAYAIDRRQRLLAGDHLVFLKKVVLLSTLDEVRVTGAARQNTTFSIDLEIRCYEGDLAANDPRIALVQVELGRLEPEAYEVVVTEKTLRFQDMKHPENFANPSFTSQNLPFEVC